jgi:predicted site-specific integrase-resolvase
MDRPKMMTAAQVQDLLHVSKSTVNTWREQGYLEAVPTPTGGWRYPTGQTYLRQALDAVERLAATS